MDKLYDFNTKLLNEYEKFDNKEELSCPLLVSTNIDYLKGLKRKILYIGQETNGWVNYDEARLNFNQETLENRYLEFIKNGAARTEFWFFIQKVLQISNEELINNIIWNNTLIAGKRYSAGTPDCSKELINISLENLLFLYEQFNPEYTIFVNGPKYPYYGITYDFLKEINSGLKDYYPTLDKPMLVDEDKKIIWTYHPNYQKRKSLHKEIIPNLNHIIK